MTEDSSARSSRSLWTAASARCNTGSKINANLASLASPFSMESLFFRCESSWAMTASSSVGDTEFASSGDTATIFRLLLSKENALPTVASLRSTPWMFIFLQSSEHASVRLGPDQVPAVISSSIPENAYLRAMSDRREAIPTDASSELPRTSCTSCSGCHQYSSKTSVHTTKLVPRNDHKKTDDDKTG